MSVCGASMQSAPARPARDGVLPPEPAERAIWGEPPPAARSARTDGEGGIHSEISLENWLESSLGTAGPSTRILEELHSA
jgi:hypothetical protein